MTYTDSDALKYLFLAVRERIESALWSLSCRNLFCDENEELAYIDSIVDMMRDVIEPLKMYDRYSDGREIRTTIEIEGDGHIYSHLWHPDPSLNKPESFSGKRMADPGEDNGDFTINVIPPQTVTVTLHSPKRTDLQLIPGGEL